MKAVCDRHQEAYEVGEGCKWCGEKADALSAAESEVEAYYAAMGIQCDVRSGTLTFPSGYVSRHNPVDEGGSPISMHTLLEEYRKPMPTTPVFHANGSPVSTIATKYETVLSWVASGFLSPEFGADMLGLPGSEAVIKRLQECADRVRKAQEVAQPECTWHAMQDALADDFAARASRYAHGQMSPDEAEKLERDARSVLAAAYPGPMAEALVEDDTDCPCCMPDSEDEPRLMPGMQKLLREPSVFERSALKQDSLKNADFLFAYMFARHDD